jgi:hypothetical protein
MTVEQRDELAETLAVIDVPWITWAVHNRDSEVIADRLVPMTRQELMAMVIVLASRCRYPMVRPDDGIVDDIAIERACKGEPMPLTSAERLEAARLLLAQGIGPTEGAERLGLDHTTVWEMYERIRTREADAA